MKRSMYKIGLLTLVLLSGAVYGQQKSDSLLFYLELAAKNNPTVLQKLDDYQAALQKVPQVGSLSDPELNVGIFLSPMELISGKQTADIQLMQMFPWFGVLKNAKDEMSLMAKAKYEAFRDAKFQVYFDVQRTWYGLQKLQQEVRISQKNIELLRSIESLSRVKFRTGPTGGVATSSSFSGNKDAATASVASSGGMQTMGGNASGNAGLSPVKPSSSMQSSSMGASSGGSGLVGLYRIQIEIGDLENSIALLKSQQKTLAAQFNSYLNRPVASIVSVSDEPTPEAFDLSSSVLSDTLLSNNPMLGMLKYEQESLDARAKMVSRMGYPMVGVGLDYSLINKSDMSTSPMNGKDMIMPMVKLTLPIYRKKYKAMQTETKWLKSATKHDYEAAANGLQTDYYAALQLFEDAQRRMKLYQSQAQLTRQTMDIVVKTFSVSGTDLTEVLQVRRQMLDYEFKQVEALTDYNTSIVWLKRLMANTQIHE